MQRLLTFFLLFTIGFSLLGQVSETTPPEYIRTIELKGNSGLSEIPVFKLGQTITLAFDDLIGDEADYYYKVSHYNFDWTPSSLSPNETYKGYDNQRIRDYKNSFNTLQIYTHYKLRLPNADLQAFKVSGNYLLEIFDDNHELVFSRKFMLYEDLVTLETEIKRARDLKFINTNQVVNFSITASEQMTLQDPARNLRSLIVQNNDLQNSIYEIKPQFNMGNKLVYKYDKETSFLGGNEFLYFDSKDVRASNVHINRIELNDIYEHYLFTDHPRFKQVYTYNPDINGSFKINTMQGSDPQVESEYTWVHFSLVYDRPIEDGEIHIYGGFNNYTIDESTLMGYNPETERYEGRYLFKQGFYNYKYVFLHRDGLLDEGFISGDFDQTENEYTVLVYYRAPGERYDRIIGLGRANSENITD